MRKTLSRVAAAGAAGLLMAVLLPAGTASAATSSDCRDANSTKVFTGGVLGSANDRLWIDRLSSTKLLVCFRSDSVIVLGGLTIVADVSPGGTLPDAVVNTAGNPLDCPNRVLGATDPVNFELRVSLAGEVCLTVGTATVTIRLVPAVPQPGGAPTLEIWRDGVFGWIDVAACPTEYALYVVFDGPTTCFFTNERLYP